MSLEDDLCAKGFHFVVDGACTSCGRMAGRLITPERLLEENEALKREHEAAVRQWHLLLQDLHAHIDPDGMDPELLYRLQITLETSCVKDCGSCQRSLDAERENEALRQIIREARDAIQQLLDADFGCGCCSEGDTWKTAPAAGKAVLERMRAAIDGPKVTALAPDEKRDEGPDPDYGF